MVKTIGFFIEAIPAVRYIFCCLKKPAKGYRYHRG